MRTPYSNEDKLGRINLQWSILLIQTLIEQGISRFVISPGSRSTPLALAVARNPKTEHWVIIDERSAAFFALGQAKQSHAPTALICTSGSAVANWLPAVVEANHASVPLLLLSADRPAELHGCGANQAIEQSQLFGVQLRGTHPLVPVDEITPSRVTMTQLITEVMMELQQPIPGPVQINIPFREPLLPRSFEQIDWIPEPLPPLPPTPPSLIETSSPSRRTALSTLNESIHGKPGIILCGEAHYSDTFYLELIAVAEQLDCPVLADPLSNLRWGHPPHPRVLCHYDGTLRKLIAANHHHPQWVIQFGDFPLSRNIARWLQQSPPDTYLVVQHKRLWSDPNAFSTETLEVAPEQFCRTLRVHCSRVDLPHWNQPFLSMEQQAQQWSMDGNALNEHQLLRQLHQHLPAQTRLFSGNSMVIRDIDGWLPQREAPLQLYANRGASGIDGNLSTVCGIRSTTPSEIPLVALLGDLTLFHDLNALSLVHKTGGNLTLIVINNGGGNIFSYLPPAQLPEFETLWLTPPEIDFEQAAKLYHIHYLRIGNGLELPQQLPQQLQTKTPKLIEWVVDRNHSIQTHQQYWESLQ